MKRLVLLLFFVSIAAAQPVFDCQQTGSSFGLPGPAINVFNTSGCAWSSTWTLTFEVNNLATSARVQIEGAYDNGGSPGTWVVLGAVAASGSILQGSNPTNWASGTLTTNTKLVVSSYFPWIRVNVPILVGAGGSTVTWLLVGAKGNGPSVAGAGGGSTPTTFSLPCNASVNVALSGTSFTQIIAGSGATVISICNLAITSASGGTPNTNTFTFAFGVCASSPTQALGPLAGVTGYSDQFFGSLQGAGGAAFCAEEGVGNGDVLTVTYLQK
jgi:hypothetical protein